MIVSASERSPRDLDGLAMPGNARDLARLRNHVDSYESRRGERARDAAARADRLTGPGDPHKASSDRTADRGDAHRTAGGRERHARWAVPVPLPGSKPSVFHGRCSHPRDRRITALGTAARPAGPGAGGSGPRCVERRIVPGGVVPSRLAAAGGGGAPVCTYRRAGRDRDLLLLVAAQRALRPAFGEASDGACGGGGCVRRLRRWRERRARSGPSPWRRTAPAAGSRRRSVRRRRAGRGEGRACRARPRRARAGPQREYGRSCSSSHCCETWRS